MMPADCCCCGCYFTFCMLFLIILLRVSSDVLFCDEFSSQYRLLSYRSRVSFSTMLRMKAAHTASEAISTTETCKTLFGKVINDEIIANLAENHSLS